MEHESILPTLDDEQVPEQPQEQAEDESGFISLMLQTFQAEVHQALQTTMMPHAEQIAHGLLSIGVRANQAADTTGHELHAAQAELQRLSGLVMAFHEAVARALGTVW